MSNSYAEINSSKMELDHPCMDLRKKEIKFIDYMAKTVSQWNR